MNNLYLLLLVLCLSSCRFESINKHNKIQAIYTDDAKEEQPVQPVEVDEIKTSDASDVHKTFMDTKLDIDDNLIKINNIKLNKAKHILMFHPWGTRSHRGQLNALLLGLLAKGYKVTGVFPNKSDIQAEGFNEIVVKDGMDGMIKKITEMMMKEDGTNLFTAWSYAFEFFKLYEEMFDDILVDYKTVMDFIEKENLTVDAMIVTGMFHYNGWYLLKKYKCSLIMINPMGPLPHISKLFGNMENPSYQPLMQLGFVEPMGFSQRLANTLYYVFEEIITMFIEVLLPGLKTKLGISISETKEMSEHFSLLLLCSHFVTHNSQAYAANTVEIGGIHCRDGQPLPEDLQEFMDNSPEGVVYVSFGSAVKPDQMTPEKKEIFQETFRKLKYPVIWKWNEDTIPNLPPNVKLSKWLPQQDLLAHPNLKVFVTHGGLLSLQEALYHQTPLVGIPLGNDQKPNLLRAQQKGYAVILDWTTLDTLQFLAAINTAFNDEELKSNMKKMHDLFTDQKESPVERAVWWIE